MGKEKFDVLDLMSVKGRLFTDEETAFLKKKYPKKAFRINYIIWKQKRHNGLYLAVFEDRNPGRIRKSAVDRSVEVIASRLPCDKEYEEIIANFGCSSRIITAYDYENIEQVVEEDKRAYNIDTPQEYINECRRRGYTRAPDLFSNL
jgi:hypothetical protein